MALTLLDGAPGQLPATKGTLVTFAGQASVKVTLVNVSGAPRTVNVYTNKNGAGSVNLGPKDLALAAGDSWTSPLATFGSGGGLLEGDADAATSVDYTPNGFEVA